MSDETPTSETQTETTELDGSQVQYLKQRLESEQNLALGGIGGFVAAVLGAGVWAGVTVASGYQIGFMSIGVGFLVGFAVRTLGKGITSAFGVVGGAFSLLGCALGNLFAVTAMVASEQGVPFLDAVVQLDAGFIQELMVASFSPMDLLFYGIALYYGYKLAFRQLTEEELERMLAGGASA